MASGYHLRFFLICVALSTFQFIKSEKNHKCQIAAFLEDDATKETHLIDSGVMDATFPSCAEDEQRRCSSVIVNEVKRGTNNGNFTLMTDDRDGYTVGDILCDKSDAVEEDVKMKRVHIYWRLCDVTWQCTGYRMPHLLCCEDGLYVPCEKVTSEK